MCFLLLFFFSAVRIFHFKEYMGTSLCTGKKEKKTLIRRKNKNGMALNIPSKKEGYINVLERLGNGDLMLLLRKKRKGGGEKTESFLYYYPLYYTCFSQFF